MVLVALAPGRAQADAVVEEYVVKKGDTCSTVTKNHYGSSDTPVIDFFHRANPNLGAVPHVLKEGSILRLPPMGGPEARVTIVRNQVEVLNPGAHPARPNESVSRGNRVSTKEDSAAALQFRDQSDLRLGEHTLVVILGDTKSRTQTSSSASLVTGSLRARLSELSGGATIDTPGATATLGQSKTGSKSGSRQGAEVQVQVDASNNSRVSVYSGEGAVISQKKKVAVPELFGSKAEFGKAPLPPKPLPPAPVWLKAPPGLMVLRNGEQLSAAATFAEGPNATSKIAKFHVVVSKDAAGTQVVQDTRVPVSVTSLSFVPTDAGDYFVRVSAIDDDQFEGPFAAVKRVRVAALRVTSEPGLQSKLEGVLFGPAVAGEDAVRCQVPGAASSQNALVSGPSAHSLLCSGGESSTTVVIPAPSMPDPVLTFLPTGRTESQVGMIAKDSETSGRIAFSVADPQGHPLPLVTVRSGLGANAGDVELLSLDSNVTVVPGSLANRVPGQFSANIRWSLPAPSQVRFALRVQGAAKVATASLPMPQALEVKPVKRAFLFEIGGGVGARFTGTPVGLALGGGLGLRIPVSGGYLGLGARASYETYGTRTSTVAAGGSSPGFVGQSVSYSHEALYAGIPITFVIGEGKFTPYVTVLPELGVQSSSGNLATGAPIEGNALLKAATGLLGAEYRVGPGAFFVEGGYRLAGTISGERLYFGMNGAQLNGGYRFLLGR
jgi:phage tail protein X